MKFTKMQGIGNDYVYVDCFEQAVRNPSELAVKMADRHFGIGGDGLILIRPSEVAPVRMQMFNADGSEAEMCGNGLRCVAKYAFEHALVPNTTFNVETGAGILPVELSLDASEKVDSVRINMGEPKLMRGQIPMQGDPDVAAIGEEIEIEGRRFQFTAVSMGNPHCVIFIEDDLDTFEVERYGPPLECHLLFPKRTNVEFINRHSESELSQRTWERGAGETLACGTGASAACAAGNLLGLSGKKVQIHLTGGDLDLEWADDGCIYMKGPAEEVFTGEWPD